MCFLMKSLSYCTNKDSRVRYWGENLLAQRGQEPTSWHSSLAGDPARESISSAIPNQTRLPRSKSFPTASWAFLYLFSWLSLIVFSYFLSISCWFCPLTRGFIYLTQTRESQWDQMFLSKAWFAVSGDPCKAFRKILPFSAVEWLDLWTWLISQTQLWACLVGSWWKSPLMG